MNRKKLLKFSLIFITIVYVGWTLISQQVMMINNNNRLADYDQKIAIQQNKQMQLKKKKEIVNTPEYMEKMAREHMGMIKPDETLFVDILANQ